ncbi:hypothetical protein STSP2_03157 [Anaerohalosphaera lusitana]|uniref:Uncharacterized protein n=1 Tax=Anaerohalosphaera lusitana TaxID=1936003 RepID=A0A1U9NQA0_9BACT|nr:hypothetical protein [Anaerohalosphaera lusitana]AQT69957.1 hypothetical protein STSP2_03157 [Anaerohalosphaera lusitana]
MQDSHSNFHFDKTPTKHKLAANIAVAMLLYVIILLAIAAGGCTDDKFVHQTFDEAGNLTSLTEITHFTAGGKEYKGLRGQAPNGWLIELEGSASQEVEIETFTAKLIEWMQAQSK